MARSTRFIRRGVQGRVRQNLNFAPIHQNSAIIITACEFRFVGGIAGAAGRPHLGEADVFVTNVGPHDPEGGEGGWNFTFTPTLPRPSMSWSRLPSWRTWKGPTCSSPDLAVASAPTGAGAGALVLSG